MNLQVGSLVYVTITSVDDMGYMVNIDDHNVVGFMSLSDAHQKRNFRRMNIGDPCRAYIVRMQSNYIDLSTKNPIQ